MTFPNSFSHLSPQFSNRSSGEVQNKSYDEARPHAGLDGDS